MKAIGMYIFGGSQTIGHLQAGWKIDTILEMTDTMLNENSYHFHKNYPNINVKLPKDYENNEDYLKQLKDEQYDLLFANPPCSGLSSINRNASVNNSINNWIYKVIDMVNTIKPKTFLIENAPTLTNKGLPILKNISNILSDYKLLIINDLAGNHNVPMYRRRTFVIGFNINYFTNIPKINMIKETCNVTEVLNNVDLTYNKDYVTDSNPNLFKYYNHIKSRQSLFGVLADLNIRDGLSETECRAVDMIKYKKDHNLGIWDKSPWRPDKNAFAPSLASVIRIIHPTENRDLYIREYAALMGYPDDFVFYTNECKTHPIQCISQGVPVNFIKYISTQIKNGFTTNDFYNGEVVYINQCSGEQKVIINYTKDKFNNINNIKEGV